MITVEIKKLAQSTNFLVTGGAGFIGSNLVGELLSIGAKSVRVLDDLSTGFKTNLSEFESDNRLEFVQGSITDFEICQQAVKDMDVVFQMAALGSVPRSIDNPIKTNEVNITGFLNILKACQEAKIKKVVYSSSSSVYGDDTHLPKVEHLTGNPLSPYAVTKKANELYARTFSSLFNMEIIGLRYFNVFGPKQSVNGPYAAVIPIFIQKLLKGEQCMINGSGEISRDFTYVQNVVEANICAAFSNLSENDDRILNVAMGEQISLNELYQLLEENIKSGLKAGYLAPRVGDIQSSQADISKAQKLIGYQPKYGLKEGVIKTIFWNQKFLSN